MKDTLRICKTQKKMTGGFSLSFYKEHYDVIIIGSALAGMSAALQLQADRFRKRKAPHPQA